MIKANEWDILILILLFDFIAFGLLALKASPIDVNALYLSAVMAAVYIISYTVMRIFFKFSDRYIMLLLFSLANIGLAMLYRLDDQLALRQVRWFIVGMAIFYITLIVSRFIYKMAAYPYLWAAVGVVLLLLPLFWGRTIGGSKNWVEIAGYTVQPSEFVKVLLVMAVAGELKNKKQLKDFLPLIIFLFIYLLILALENDLGTIAIYIAVFVAMLYVATSKSMYVLSSLAITGVGGYVAYILLGHVRTRVEAWINPWADATGRGYQIAQSLIAIGSGGWFGAGLGLGEPNTIPAAKTDFIFAAIAEEFGVLMAVAIIIIYFIIIYRCMLAGLHSENIFDALVVIGSATMLGVQTVLIIGGVIKFIPLTGVTLPFVSYGGSSLITSFILLALIQRVTINNYVQSLYKRSDVEEELDETY